MNAADSERIEGQLMSLGIRPLREGELMDEIQLQITNDRMGTKKKSKEKNPDIIVLNTCSIRDHAEQKVYSYLGPHAKRKQAGEDVTIVVAGCVAQQEGQSLLRRVPEIDLVMGPQYANRIADLLEDVANGNQVVATEASHIMEDSTKPRRTSATCAWVNVIYGCNEVRARASREAAKEVTRSCPRLPWESPHGRDWVLSAFVWGQGPQSLMLSKASLA